MSNIAVKLSELENATTFQEIFGVYIEVLANRSQDGDGYYLYGHEKELAKDSLYNLADFLDKVTPFGVEQWGEINRMKHGVEEND
tara:strand:- start:877 stop:1131 length:255 start_codon:yes stop_codon:yes gene_type:complete